MDVVYWPRHLRQSEASPLCVRLSANAVCVVGTGVDASAGLERLPAASSRRRVVLLDADIAALGGFSALHAPQLLGRIGRELAAVQREETKMQRIEAGDGALRRMLETAGYLAVFLPSLLLLKAADAFRYVVEDVQTPRWLVVGGGKSLAALSTFLAVLVHQLHNAASLPTRVRNFYLTSKQRRLSHQEKTKLLEVCNWICVTLLDVMLGRLAVVYSSELAASAFQSTNISPHAVVEFLRDNVEWLMGAPAGFKLNKPLASILGNGILLWLELWSFVFTEVLPQRDHAGLGKWLLLVCSHMGVTLQLTLLSDLVNLATWHSHWVYLYFAKLNRLQFGLFSSLSKLFLGKKINVLRHRVDSCEYDVSQLLLGTLLLTILAFLVTTNLVFFVFFAAVRATIVFIWVVLWLPVVVLSSLPLASLAYRVWKPHFFAIGMQLQTCDKLVAYSSVATVENVGMDSQPPRNDLQNRRTLRRALASWEANDCASCKEALFELVPVVCSSSALFTRLRAYLQAVTARYSLSAILQASLFGKADIARVPLNTLFGLPDIPDNTS